MPCNNLLFVTVKNNTTISQSIINKKNYKHIQRSRKQRKCDFYITGGK